MLQYLKKLLHIVICCFIYFIQVFSSDNNVIEKLNAYDVKFYFLDLEVDNISQYIEGCTTVLIETVNPDIDTIFLELTDSARVDSIHINDQPVSFTHSENLLHIPLLGPIIPETLISVTVFYNVTNKNKDDNRGVSTEIASFGKSVTWTLSEPFSSKSWFPCKQILDDKADSLYLFFTVPDSVRVGSNGILTSISEMPGGKWRFEWKSYYPVAYYLISFAVADYMDYSFYVSMNVTDSVLIQNYIYNDSSFFTTNKESIDATSQILEVFNDHFGPYPFSSEKYGHCIAPIGGGMEHQTMTTLGNFSFLLVAHELAHQWFGDNVTCQNWQDVWINEGFASYCEFIALENLKTNQEVQEWLSEAFNLVVSEPDGSIYIPETDSANQSRIFNYRLSYRKGAYVIHMIRHELGDDQLFFDVLRTFQERYKDNVADINDFISVLEELSQKDFSAFFNQWYYGEGYPTLDFYWTQNQDTLSIKIQQEVSAPSVTPFFNLLLDLNINYLGGDTLIQLRQTSPESIFNIVLNERVYQLTPDPENKLLAKIRSVVREFDEDSASRFMAFPNPADNNIFIENYNIGLPFTAKLYSPGGVLIHEIEGSGAFGNFDVSALNTGIYQIVVLRDQHKEVFKIAKL